MNEVKLPPLPAAVHINPSPYGPVTYAVDQMRDYATAAVLAERERCAVLCERIGNSEYTTDADDCAAAIRKGEMMNEAERAHALRFAMAAHASKPNAPLSWMWLLEWASLVEVFDRPHQGATGLTK